MSDADMVIVIPGWAKLLASACMFGFAALIGASVCRHGWEESKRTGDWGFATWWALMLFAAMAVGGGMLALMSTLRFVGLVVAR